MYLCKYINTWIIMYDMHTYFLCHTYTMQMCDPLTAKDN